MIDTDALSIGIGVVLVQRGHPIAYIGKTLAPMHNGLFTCEKELMVLVYIAKKQKPYLIRRHFTIKTSHFSLKYLLEHKISTSFVSKWLPKLLRSDYHILYKKDSENSYAYALSRFLNAQMMELTLSTNP